MSKLHFDNYMKNSTTKRIIEFCVGLFFSLLLLCVGIVTVVQNSRTTNVFCTVVSTDDGDYYNVLNGGKVYWDNTNVGLCLGENLRIGKLTTLSAKPNDGYSFVGYYSSMDTSSQLLSANKDYTFAVSGDISQIYAKFAKNVDVDFTLTDPNDATVQYSFTETFYVGQEVKITDVLSANTQIPENIIQYYENSTPSTMQGLVNGGYVCSKNTFIVGVESTSLSIEPSEPSFVGAWLDQLGTELDPYLITSASELTSFANAVNNGNTFENIYLKLTTDITTTTSFSPIGTKTNSFQGTFDGAGYTITIASLATITENSYLGLFGYNEGTIKNVKVAGAIAGAVGSGDYEIYVGGIAGYNTGTIYNCSVSANHTSTATATTISTDKNYIGGIVGINQGLINKCYVYDVSSPSTLAQISGSATAGVAMGGIAGINIQGGEIYNCYNTAAVSGSNYEWVGGITGENHGKIENCFNTGNISGKAYVGGIAGQNNVNTDSTYGVIVNTYNSGTVTSTVGYVGGVVGYNDSSASGSLLYNYYKSGCATSTSGTVYSTGSTAYDSSTLTLVSSVTVGSNSETTSLLTALQNGQSYLATSNSIDFIEWKTNSSYFSGNPTIYTTEFNTATETTYESGTGTQNDPWGISTEAQLNAFASSSNANKWAILTNSIQLTTTHTMIGSSSNPFTGVFDGAGFTISGVYCGSSSTDYVGFFAYNAGTIKNLNILTTGTGIVGQNYVGGIAGYNSGTIYDVSFSGIVNGSGNYVGGIVGANKGTIDTATNKASVTGSGSSSVGLGGIAGVNLDNNGNGVIKNCYNDGYSSNYVNNVTGTNYQWVGGIAGENTGGIYNSYNNMEISGNAYVGGIAGQSSGTITNNYNRGTVHASNTYVGGIAGDVSPVVLPTGYKQVEYIQSTGTQRIVTDYTPNSNTCITMTFSPTSLSSNQTLFCARSNLKVNTFTSFIISSSIRADFNTTQTATSLGVSVNNQYVYTMKNGVVTLNGTSVTIPTGIFTAGGPMAFFASYTTSTTTSLANYSKLKFYSCKIYEGNTLVRDYIPVIRLADTEAGLYDKVTGTFYTNAGTGSFLYDSSVDLNTYTTVDYIESTGTQCINTGYYWTHENVRCVLDAIVTSNSAYQSLFGNEEYMTGSTRYFSGIPHGTNYSYAMYVGNGGNGSFSLTQNTRFLLDWSTTTEKVSTVILNGTTVINQTYSNSVITNPNKLTTGRGNIHIFCNYNTGSGGQIQKIGGMKVYSFKMYDNNVLVRDFVPCYRNSDNVVGMYDKVTGTFYTNAGTGTFTAGSDVLGLSNNYYLSGCATDGNSTVQNGVGSDTKGSTTANPSGVSSFGSSDNTTLYTNLSTWQSTNSSYSSWVQAGNDGWSALKNYTFTITAETSTNNYGTITGGDGWTIASGGKSATYNIGGGFAIASLPTVTPTDGYTFDGWFTNSTSGTQVQVGDTFNANTTIYAHYTSLNYSITTGANYGTVSVTGTVATNTGRMNQAITITATASQTGYTFTDCSIKIYAGSDATGTVLATISNGGTFTMTTYSSSIYIYATWTRTANTYTVTFDGVDNNIYIPSSAADEDGWYNYANIVNDVYPGTNMFTKCYNSSIQPGNNYIAKVEIKNYVSSGNVTLYIESSGNINNTYGSGQFAFCSMLVQNGTYYKDMKSIDLSASSYDKFFLRTHLAASGVTITSLSIRISVYQSFSDKTATYDTPFSVVAPTRTGYTFAGWTVTSGLDASTAYWGTSSTADTQLTSTSTKCINGVNAVYFKNLTATSGGNVTLTANWTANTYTVTFDKQNGTGGSDSVTATYGSAMPSVTIPTRSGYTFAGYYDAVSGGTQYYTSAGASAKNWDKASNTTLYAQWTANTYNVFLDYENGASVSIWDWNKTSSYSYCSVSDEVYTATTVSGNTYSNVKVQYWNNSTFLSQPLTETTTGVKYLTFTKTSSFNKLRIGLNGSKNDATFYYDVSSLVDEQTYTIQFRVVAFSTLTATIQDFKLELGNKTDYSAPVQQVTFDSTYGDLPTPIKTGYTFAGWEPSAMYEFSSSNYSYKNYSNKLTVSWEVDTNYGNYIHIVGASGDTAYCIEQNSFSPVTAGKNYQFICMARSNGYSTTQYFQAGSGGWNTNIIWETSSSTSTVAMTSHLTFTNDGEWQLVTITLTAPTGAIGVKIHLGADQPNLPENAYLDVAYPILVEDTTISSSTNVTIAKDHTLYAQWTANTYVVTLDATGGTGGTDSVSVTYDSAMPSATMPTRSGYTFAGYYDAVSGGTQYYTASGASAKNWDKTSDTTLYAKWTANNYTVTADANGGSISSTTGWTVASDGESATKTVTYDSTYGTLPTPTLTGYSFIGWNIELQKVPDNSTAQWVTTVINNEWVTAKLKPNTKYTYSYDMTLTEALPSGYTASQTNQWGNFGYRTGTSSFCMVHGSIYSQIGASYTAGTTVHQTGTFTTPSDISTLVFVAYATRCENSAGSGYATKGTLSTIKFVELSTTIDSSTIVSEAYDHTLYAQLTASIYTITLDNQSATSAGTTEYYEKYNTGMYTTSACSTTITAITAPTRTGYTFGGYYTAKSGGGTQYINESGIISATETTFTENTTLYAKWTANSYTVTVDASGGSISSTTGWSVASDGETATKTVTYDSTYGTLPTPTRVGYAFSNWCDSLLDVDEFATAVSNNVTNNGTCVYDSTNKAFTIKASADNSDCFTSTYAKINTFRMLVKQNTNYVFSWKQSAINEKVRNFMFFYSDCSSTSFTVVSEYEQYSNGYYYLTANSGSNTCLDIRLGTLTATALVLSELRIYEGTEPIATGTSGELITASSMVAIPSNHTLYAHWTANPYTVTADANGGSISATTGWTVASDGKTATKTVTYDSTYGTLPTPTKTGYTFDGWESNLVTNPSPNIIDSTAYGFMIATLTEDLTSNTTYAFEGKVKRGTDTTGNISLFLDGGYVFVSSITVTGDWQTWKGTFKTGDVSTYTHGGTKIMTLYNIPSSNCSSNPASVEYFYIWKVGGSYTTSTTTNNIAGNNKLRAHWTANTYEVAYKGNGSTSGTMSNSTHTYDVAKNLTTNAYSRAYTVTYNYNYTGSTNTTATATYTFNGWNTVAGGTGTSYADKASVTNLSSTQGATFNLYAQWTSASLVLPTPTRTGYTFGGWYAEESCTTSVGVGGASYTPTANKTLYAKWIANSYTVGYNLGYQSENLFRTSLSSITNVGLTTTYDYTTGIYTINGTQTSSYAWFVLAKTDEITFTSGDVYNIYFETISGTMTTNVGFPYINFEVLQSNGGSNLTTRLNAEGSITKCNSVGMRVYTITANDLAESSGKYIVARFGWVSSSVTSFNTFTDFKFKISCYKGTPTNEISAPVGKTVDYDSAYGDLENVTREGYTFNGWWTEESGGTQVTSTTIVKTASNHTIYAHWTANTYEVAYNGNGSTSGTMSNSTHTYDVAKNLTANAYSRAYTVTYNYNYTGSTNTTATATYTFNGWNTVAGGTGTSYANQASVTNLSSTQGATVNLYAQWTDGNITLPTPTRTGYTFGGWYAESSCTTSVGAGGASYTPTANKTLYAKWTVNTYTVTLEAKGGSGGTASVTATYGSAMPSATMPTRTGYTFNGYFDAESGGTQYYTSAGASARNWDKISDTTLYAQWTANTYTVTADANGGSISSTTGWTVASDGKTATKTVTYDSTYGTLPTPTRTGYAFDGWKASSDYTSTAQYSKLTDVSYRFTPSSGYYTTIFQVGKAVAFDITFEGTINYIDINDAPVPVKDYTIEDNRVYGITIITSSRHIGSYSFLDLNFNTLTSNTFTINKYEVIDFTISSTESTTKVTTTIDHTLYAKWTANDLTFNNQTLAGGTYGTAYSQSFTGASNGTETYTYSITGVTKDGSAVTASSGKYNGLSLSGTTISGTPTAVGTYVFSITAKDSGSEVTKEATMTITIAQREVSLAWGTLTWTYDGSAHSTTCTAGNLVSGDTCKVTLSNNSITDVGTKTVTATGLSNSNYKLPSSVTETLTVNKETLSTPTNLEWSKSSRGTATWTASTVVTGITITYSIQLYKGETSSTVTTTSTSYDFKETIKSTGAGVYTFKVTAISSNTTNCASSAQSSASDNLYAVKVTIVKDTGISTATVNGSASAVIINGESLDVVATASTGYHFTSWSSSSTNATFTSSTTENTNVTLSASTTSTDDITITANADPNQYTVTFNSNNGGTPSPTSKTVIYASTYGTLATCTRTGYSLAGWYTDASGGTKIETSTTVSITENQTLYAHWNKTSYSITYTLNGGTNNANNPSSYTVESETITLQDPTKTGYTFTGWTGSNGSTAQKSVQITKGSTGDKSYTANWEENTYTITFNGNGNTGGATADKTMTYDKAEQIANGFTRAYTVTYNANSGTVSPASNTATYTFAGWKSSVANGSYGSTSACGTSITTSVVIKATDYVKNLSSTNGASVTFTAQWTEGSVTLPTPTRTGYTFAGWFSDVGCTSANKIGDANASYVPSKDITIYAKWNVNQYTITLNGNNGTGGTASVKYTYNSSTKDPSTITNPTRTGYTFGGWSKTKNTNDIIITTTGELAKSTSYTSASGTWTYANDVTLYAYWTANTYTVSYAGMDNATYGDSHPESATYDSEFTVTTPTKVGYTFAGWNITGMDSCTHTYGTSTTTATSLSACKETTYKNLRSTSGTVTFTATWTANTNTVYTVNHYFQKLGSTYDTSNLNNFELTSQKLTGKTDAKVTPSYMTHTGFTAYGQKEITILGDGSAVVNYFYKRSNATVTLMAYQQTQGVTFTGEGSYEYNASVTITATIKSGYTWLGWVLSDGTEVSGLTESTNGLVHTATFNMPESSVTYYASAKIAGVASELLIGVNETTKTATIISYTGNLSTLVIPEVVNKDKNNYAVDGNMYLVTAISANAFTGNTLKNITLPDSVINIGANAFSGCSALNTIKINGVGLTIGEMAFSSTTNATGYTRAIYIDDVTILETIVGSELYATNPNGSFGNLLVNVGCLVISKEVYEQNPTLSQYILDHYSVSQDGGEDKVYTDKVTGKKYYVLLRSGSLIPSDLQ